MVEPRARVTTFSPRLLTVVTCGLRSAQRARPQPSVQEGQVLLLRARAGGHDGDARTRPRARRLEAPSLLRRLARCGRARAPSRSRRLRPGRQVRVLLRPRQVSVALYDVSMIQSCCQFAGADVRRRSQTRQPARPPRYWPREPAAL